MEPPRIVVHRLHGRLRTLRRLKNQCIWCIGFFISFPGAVSVTRAQSNDSQIYPHWYDQKTHQVDWSNHPSSAAFTNDSFPVLGRWQWGVCYGGDVRGDRAFIGNGNLFQTVDLNDPEHPSIIGELPLDYPQTIRIQDSIAYIAGGKFYTVDISDPTNPAKLGEVQITWPFRVAPAESLVFVGSHGRLSIVDVTDPGNPYVRSELSTPGEFPFGLANKGRVLYVGYQDFPNIWVYDAANPDDPQPGPVLPGAMTAGLVSDTLLLVGNFGVFELYSVVDPLNPVFLGRDTIGVSSVHWIYSIARDGNTVFVLTQDAGVFAIDISDPRNPFTRGEWAWPYTTSYYIAPEKTGLGLFGPYLFATNGNGFSTIDRSNPDSLSEIAFQPTGGIHSTVEVRDSLAFIGCGMAGLWILDVSDPFHPVPISNVFMPSGFTADLVIDDSLVYLVNWAYPGRYLPGRGLWIIDISDVHNPQILSHHTGITGFGSQISKNTIAKEGNLVYITQVKPASSDSVLEIIDVSNPASPQTIGVYRMQYSPYRIAVRDSIAYLGTSDGGLRIIDCHNPSSPNLMAVPSTGRGIAVFDSLAYVEATDLEIYNVSDPGAPVLLSTYDMDGPWVTTSAVLLHHDELLYWASENTRGIFGVSDPTTPTLRTRNNIGATDVALSGSNIVYTNEDDGTCIVQNNAILRSASYELSNGWNLLSLPIEPQSPSPTFVFPTARAFYSYEAGAYHPIDTLHSGFGFWVKLDSGETIDVFGAGIRSDTFHLAKGWNIIGSVDSAVAVGSIVIEPDTIFRSELYSYDSGYDIADSIRPGSGYWVKVSGDCRLILSPASIPPAEPSNVSSRASVLKEANRLVFRDSYDNRQVLYFGMVGGQNPGLELPPPVPGPGFDVRFSDNTIFCSFDPRDTSERLISVRHGEVPLIVEWKIHKPGEAFRLYVNNECITLRDEGEIRLGTPVRSASLRLEVDNSVPADLELSQNFPNPFNNETRISFSIPEQSLVEVTLLNVLGERIRIIREEVMTAGRYSVTLDMEDLASGVYYYRIRSLGNSITKKLLFLK